MGLYQNLLERRCERKGHDWFPDQEHREFIPVQAICMRCRERHIFKPWGQCLSGHPIAEHYDSEGHMLAVGDCEGPQ